MTSVKEMIADLIKREGGFVNHPADKGGATKYGITLTTLSVFLDRQCTVDDVKNLSKDTAARIYELNYFLKPKIDRLPVEVQPLLFDMAVNHGPKKAIQILQSELYAHTYSIGKADGVIGRLTIEATQSVVIACCNDFINALVKRRIAFYKAIVKSNPSQAVFLDGWLARANSFYV